MENQNDKKSVYEVLSNINVKPKLEKKGQVDYLSWANAWGMVKQAYPDANYKITEFPEFIQTKNGWEPTGRDVDYRQTSAGVEIEAVVTIKGESYSSKLFVMDYRNKPVFNPNYFDINKTQQRALVKALAIAGLGLNVYAGEDLPNFVDGKPKFKEKAPRKGKTQAKTNNLKDYTVNYNGQLVPMYLVVKHASEGNQKARDFANSLKGKDLEIFTSLAKNGVVS